MNPIRAAMVRFTTLDPARWPRVVRALAALGFNAIDVPLVWREHETAPGVFDFATDRRDVGALLDLAAAEGLRAVVRLGPLCARDAPGLGLPERVLRDRACQARTRRQNPVLVPDPPRLVPLPSVASSAYRREAASWVGAAATAIAPHVARGTVARVAVGHGPHPLLRDDPFELDHHPDAPGSDPQGPPAGAASAVERETAVARDFLLALVDAATAAGVPADRLVLAIPGGALVSALAAALDSGHRLHFGEAPPSAGARSIWRQMRYAAAFIRAPHVDLRAGCTPFEAPVRAIHAVLAARLALAAGVTDYTVAMGCAGDRWIGALLDAHGDPRNYAPEWQRLNAWAATLPRGRERTATLVIPAAAVVEARAATAVHPLPLGWLAARGLTPGALAADGASRSSDGADAPTVTDHDRVLRDLERALTVAALPWRRAPEHAGDQDDPLAFTAGDAAAWLDRARAALSALAPRVVPEGAALVRAVETRGEPGATGTDAGVCLVVVATGDQIAEVTAPATGSWRVAGDGGEGAPAGSLVLTPGEALVLVQHRGGAP